MEGAVSKVCHPDTKKKENCYVKTNLYRLLAASGRIQNKVRVGSISRPAYA